MNSRFSLMYPGNYIEGDINGITVSEAFNELHIDRLVVPYSNNALPWELSGNDISHYFTKDAEVIKYRIDIIEDLLNNPAMYDAFEAVLPQIRDILDIRSNKNVAADTTACLFSIFEIKLYTDCIDSLYKGIISSISLKSSGLKHFAEMVAGIYESNEYKNLKSEFEKVGDSIGSIKSVTLGVNLDAQLRTVEAGVVSVNSQLFRSGDIFDRIMRFDLKDDGYRCITPLIPYGRNSSEKNTEAYNAAMNKAIDTIFRSTVKNWQPVIRRYISKNTDFIVFLGDDIRFHLGAVDFIKKLKKLGLPVCKPQIRSIEEKAFLVDGIYNPYIVLQNNKSDENGIVLNDFAFDENGMIYILTGPNQGGKSVITYAVGITQALFQLGIFVPARSAEISPVDNIFTHFPAKEDTAINKGRLGEECDRLQKMFRKITQYSLVLMDETLSSTSAIEAAYIAGEVLMGLSFIGCKCVFATHLHDLSQRVDELNRSSDGISRIDNLVAILAD